MTGETGTYRFRIEIDGEPMLWFMEATGLGMPGSETAAPQPRKLPGLRKYTNVTFRKGLAGSDQALAWIQSKGGAAARRSIRIILAAEDGSDTAIWQVQNAWPVKSSVSGNLIEIIEIACEDTPRLDNN